MFRKSALFFCTSLAFLDSLGPGSATCNDVMDPQYCLRSCPALNLATANELLGLTETPNNCNEASWPDVKTVSQNGHALLTTPWAAGATTTGNAPGTCGQCKVLVENFQNYGTCDAYCEVVGRGCSGAWEELSDSCIPETEIGCDQALDTGDVICECGYEAAHPKPPPPPPSPPGACDESTWPDVENGFVCGECKVLVENFATYGSCDAYCEAIGRTCSGAWEEVGDTCTEQYEMDCDTQVRDTTDVICECSPPWDAPSPPPPPPHLAAPCYFERAGWCYGNDDCAAVGYSASPQACWDGCYAVYGNELAAVDIDEFNTDGDCYEDPATGEFLCHCCCQNACPVCYGGGTESLVVAYGYGELPPSCGADPDSDEVLYCGPPNEAPDEAPDNGGGGFSLGK